MRLPAFSLVLAWVATLGAIANSGVAEGQSAHGLAEALTGARSALGASYLAERRDSVDGHITEAVRLARQAVAVAPQEADAHYWLAAALGRRARRAGFTTAVRAGREAYLEARQALRLDSLHAGAHAVVGGFHEAVARLNWPVRTMVTTLVGLPEVRHASLATAEREYRLAVRLEPTAMQFRNDLGGFLARLGRRADAEQQWREARELPGQTAVDQWLLRDLRRRIDETARP